MNDSHGFILFPLVYAELATTGFYQALVGCHTFNEMVFFYSFPIDHFHIHFEIEGGKAPIEGTL